MSTEGREAGYKPDKITPAMLDAGEAVLRDTRWITAEGIQWLDALDWGGESRLPHMLGELFSAMNAAAL
jgi:hypothetical protein